MNADEAPNGTSVRVGSQMVYVKIAGRWVDADTNLGTLTGAEDVRRLGYGAVVPSGVDTVTVGTSFDPPSQSIAAQIARQADVDPIEPPHVVVLLNGREDVVCSCGAHFSESKPGSVRGARWASAITYWAEHYREATA